PSTSLWICPVTQANGVAIGPEGQVWGPVTRRIADAYQRFVDHDFVGQYLKRYTEGMGARACECAIVTVCICPAARLHLASMQNPSPDLWHGTTILTVRKGGVVAIG